MQTVRGRGGVGEEEGIREGGGEGGEGGVRRGWLGACIKCTLQMGQSLLNLKQVYVTCTPQISCPA